jgi:hypothetical protein
MRFRKWQYISGGFWVAKKHVMEEIPLDESKLWGHGEDTKWSLSVIRSKKSYEFSMNANSTVHLLVQKNPAFGPITNDCYKKIGEFLKIEEKARRSEKKAKEAKAIRDAKKKQTSNRIV